MDDPHRDILEHADGRPASPELEHRLREHAQTKAQLAAARADVRELKGGLAPLKLDDTRRAALLARINEGLRARVIPLWAKFAAAAAVIVAIGGISLVVFSNRPVDNRPTDEVAVQRKGEWHAALFAPQPGEQMGPDLRLGERKLTAGAKLELGRGEYARLTDAVNGAIWLVYPETTLIADGKLKLEGGAIELEKAPSDSVEVVAGARTYASNSTFTLARMGQSLLVSVASGVVRESDSEGKTKVLGAGDHTTSDDVALPRRIKAAAAYVKGFEAWRAQEWMTASGYFKAAAQSDELDDPTRRYAHFYWFAAAGRDTDTASAVSIGEAFVARWPDDLRATYVKYFIGAYSAQLGDKDKARQYLRPIAEGAAGNLKDAAKLYLDALDGRTTDDASRLWQVYFGHWQKREFARGIDTLREITLRFPADPRVTNGEASFQLFSCLGNAGKLEDAIGEIDNLLAKYPKHRACDYALYFKAQYLAQLGKHADALAALDLFDGKYPNSPMREHADILRKTLAAQDK